MQHQHQCFAQAPGCYYASTTARLIAAAARVLLVLSGQFKPHFWCTGMHPVSRTARGGSFLPVAPVCYVVFNHIKETCGSQPFLCSLLIHASTAGTLATKLLQHVCFLVLPGPQTLDQMYRHASCFWVCTIRFFSASCTCLLCYVIYTNRGSWLTATPLSALNTCCITLALQRCMSASFTCSAAAAAAVRSLGVSWLQMLSWSAN